ncbi:MAG: type I-G CRISPR-associated RAMP protein Csb1/Cas7g [Acidimicrobiales bacterium]
MTKQLSAELLISACEDSSCEAGITIRTELEPLAGDGTPVKPATYAGGKFQTGRRWIGEGADRSPVDILVIDNEPSQANRLEAALQARINDLGLPDITLDLSQAGQLPPHLPKTISIFQFPHRQADAYLRDAMLEGTAFSKTEVGKLILAATTDDAAALMKWCPQAILYGFWQSHLGKKRSQAKKARSWISEIIGIEPAAEDVRRFALKGDPLNLSADLKVIYDENAVEGWAFGEEAKSTAKGKKDDGLSNIGHGQALSRAGEEALAGVSFRKVTQTSTVSFASLRTVRTGTGSAQARAVLVALGLVAHLGAFGRAFTLRSGADLRSRSSSWWWLGESEDEELDVPTFADASALLTECVKNASEAGVPVGQWKENRLIVTPNEPLLKAIKNSWPQEEG